jgi:uncharacterized protein YecE (DUF72 family)
LGFEGRRAQIVYKGSQAYNPYIQAQRESLHSMGKVQQTLCTPRAIHRLLPLPAPAHPDTQIHSGYRKIYNKTGLSQRFALEVRNMKLFDKNYIEWASRLNITWVSVDSPDFPLEVYNTNGIVYLRMHGRTAWYSHYYTDEELEEVAQKIMKTNPEKVYVFFNNNHAMLENARRMLQIMQTR